MRSIVRVLLSIALTASLLPLGAGPARACSCAFVTKEEHAESADVVFTGRVLRVKQNDRRLLARFRVTRVYKGRVGRRIEVWTAAQESACGCNFREGAVYSVFGDRMNRSKVSTNICSGTKRGRIDPDRYGLPPGERP